MRSRKYRITVAVEKLSNHTIRFLLRRGIAPRMWAMLEAVGRRAAPADAGRQRAHQRHLLDADPAADLRIDLTDDHGPSSQSSR
jgi:hypothetical protein